MDPTVPAVLLREARRRAGVSQRELARRAGTAHSVVARIEAGTTSPTWNSLARLLKAAGFALDAALIPAPVVASHVLDDVERILKLSPEERLRELANAARFADAARAVE